MRQDTSRRRMGNLRGIVVALVILILVVTIGSGKFLTTTNIMNVLRQVSALGVMACAGAFVLIGGNIDLSVGSTLSLCGLISCSLTGMGTPIAIVVPLIVGLLCGALNGFMVGRLRFNPFITTLGTMAVFQALAYYTTDGKFINAAANNSFMQIGQGFLLVVPIPVLILLGVFALLSYVLTQTVFGR